MSVTLEITGIIAKISDLINKGNTNRVTLTIPENIYLGPQRGRKTEWHYVTLWGKHAERAVRDLKVGAVVKVRCTISYYKNANGTRITNFNATDIDYIKGFGRPDNSHTDHNPTDHDHDLDEDIPF